MSRALALVRFKDSGNIYMGCYSGTSDVMYPYILPPEKCKKSDIGMYDPIGCISEFCNCHTERPIYNESEISDIEIYSDYGGGFFWDGKGVERLGYICPDYQNPWRTSYGNWWEGDPGDDILIVDGVPDWAQNFMDNMS